MSLTIGKNAKISNTLTFVLLILTGAQGYISNPPFTAEEVNFLSPLLLMLVLIVGFLKNYFAPDVDSKAQKALLIVTVVGILGALNQYFFDLVHWSDRVEQILRLVLTVTGAALSALSKQIWPTELSLTEKNYRQ